MKTLTKNRQLQLGEAERGFALLEIVLALALFSIVAVGMTQALDQIAQASKLSRQEAEVTRALDSILAEVTHQPEFKQARYELPKRRNGINAVATVQPAVLINRQQTELEKMYRVQASAWLNENSKELLRRSIETYVYSPSSDL